MDEILCSAFGAHRVETRRTQMNLQKMMQQAQQMQQKLADMQARLEAEETEGSAGGGLVKLRLNGKRTLLNVSIDDSLMRHEEKEVLEDLLVAAHNDACGKIESSASQKMSAMTSGLNLPPGLKLPF
ncbi:MAG: YbaB/EbfC family nucleoid-associated protein [Pseudomonadota bacterium]|nr:YbaB/EbfC family nucleoid-associated protein [Pseudomonadota bacterium]MDE3037609.1 YbaB/EbfC family nucleoid-associated protein [Pseudomonadota bacterium]